MALTGPGLGDMIKAALTESAAPTNPGELDKFAMALGQAIVDYILANAIVTGTVISGQGAGGAITGKVS